MKYKIIITNISIAESEIQGWLDKGWRPFGNPFFREDGKTLIQILIK